MGQLRIALVSYEYAGSKGGGGIGTYVRNAASMLAGRGHDVEVFCARSESPYDAIRHVRVWEVSASRREFPSAIAAAFAERHADRPFDVVEGPEYGADAAGIRSRFPSVPLVVRLHTPTFLIGEISVSYISLESKLRYVLGGLRRGEWPKLYWRGDPGALDAERDHTVSADRVVAPCAAILEKVGGSWRIPASKCAVVPNVFLPPATLLDLPPATGKTVLFLGKLEVRKGVIELARAVPLVAQQVPDVEFVMVGRSSPLPGTNRPVGDVMQGLYGVARDRVRHVDGVPYDEITDLFASSTIAVFPSTWENFPNVCLEGMAAGRGVIGSSAGGMAEIIEDQKTGLLCPPRDHAALAEAIVSLLKDPERHRRLGSAARDSLVRFGPDRIGPLQEEVYRQAIGQRRQQPPTL